MDKNKEIYCIYCHFPISEHPGEQACSDDEEILGRYMEVVNEYASTCDGCGELTMHEEMEMDEETQLGYCNECAPEFIKDNN